MRVGCLLYLTFVSAVSGPGYPVIIMRFPKLSPQGPLILFVFALWFVALNAATWSPIQSEDRAATVSPKGKDVDAEVLFSQTDLTFENNTTTKKCYRRVKVYSARGVEAVQKFGIENTSFQKVEKVFARLTKPNGVSVEFTKADFHETALVKMGGTKWTSRRLLLATLAPGDIVEFKWVEWWEGWALFQLVYCQENLPVRDFQLNIDIDGIMVNYAWYHMPTAKLQKIDEARSILTASNLPAFETEPDMPPELETRGYILIAYGEVEHVQQLGWRKKAGWLSQFAKEQATPDAKIRTLAESLCGKSDSNEEKHRRFYAYCQEKIVNVDFDESPQSIKERNKSKESKTAALVLKSCRGNSMEVNFLFAALATAVGTDARVACLCPKDFLLNTDISNGWYFLAPTLVAAKEGGDWVFFNPGSPAQACGELRWQEEGTSALLSDPLVSVFVPVPTTPARKNVTVRQANLALTADGTLEGQVTITHTGQAALQWRILHRSNLRASIEKELRDEVTTRIPGAEVEQIEWENLQKPGLPLLIRYHLRVPNYATLAGSRLFLSPNVFEVGAPPRYPAEARHQPFFYPYAYQVDDDIHLVIPRGLVANTLEQPKPVNNDTLPLHQNISWQFDSDTNTLAYKRDFKFGTSGSEYSPILYIVPGKDASDSEKAKSVTLHSFLTERLRARNSQTIALEPSSVSAVTEGESVAKEKL